jgi:asparagine synthase (glutamine-hydrolysing)
MESRRGEPVILGLYDPLGRSQPATVRERFERALRPFGAVEMHERGPLTAGTGGAADSPAREGPLCLLEGYLDDVEAPAQTLRALWATEGTQLPAALRGSFAIVVWDDETQTGVIARDQLGQRPLFLYESGPLLYFASEVRLLLAALPRRPQPDRTAIALWLAPGGSRESPVPYEGVRRLPSGHLVELGRGRWMQRRYWSPRYVPPLTGTPEELAPVIRHQLGLATRRAMGGAQRVGVFLSGGLDSSSVAAVAHQELRREGRLHAYAATFPEFETVDESRFIDSVVRSLGLGITRVDVNGGSAWGGALEFLDAWSLPEVSSNGFFQRPLARRAAEEGAEVVLSGEGGDELFGAPLFLLADRVARGRFLSAWRLVQQFPHIADVPWRSYSVRMLLEHGLQPLAPAAIRRALTLREERARLPPYLRPEVVATALAHTDPQPWRWLDGPRWWRAKADVFARRHSAIGATDQMVRAARMGGIVERHPLLADLDLVEFVLRLPPEHEFDPYRTRPDLRRAVAGLLADDVRMRREKATFDALRGYSLVDDLPVIAPLVRDPGARIHEFVRPDAVASLLGELPVRWGLLSVWGGRVWRLAVMESFLRQQEDENFARDLLESGRLAAPKLRFHEDPAS